MSNVSSSSLFIFNASQLITPLLSSDVPGVPIQWTVIENGAILAQQGRIVAVGSTETLRADSRISGATAIDATGRVLAPGFVDSHTHLVFAATRQEEYEMRLRGSSYEALAAAGGGIRNSVRRLRATSEEELYAAARRRCEQFVAHGTTTLEAKSGYGLDLENELKILRVLRRLNEDPQVPVEIVPTFLGAHEVPDECRSDRAAYVRLICDEMIPRVVAEHLAEFCDVFCEPSVFNIDESRQILKSACERGLKLKIHADQLTHNGGARLAIEMEAASADHLEHIDASDISRFSQSRTVATLLPGAAFHLGLNQFAPARALLAAGAKVALATDFNPGTSPTVNMQIILSIAGAYMQVTPAEAFTAATLGGALALGREHSVGSLEVGKQADLVVYNVSDYRLVPYHFGMNLVERVFKKGCLVFSREGP